MILRDEKKNKLRIAERYLFPGILLLYPLVAVNQGIDVSDSTYSLTNFRFFTEISGTWSLATWLANAAGFLLMKLPFGGTLLGMNVYTSLIVSAMALLSYYFLKGKMPAWVAFVGEIIAISFCWCPTTILYNYLTYFFFLAGCVLLYRGLIWERKGLLVWAGVCLGLNVMVRTPNIVEALLIAAVFYYGRISGKKWSECWKNTGWCVTGFFIGFLASYAVISVQYGPAAYFEMFGSLAGYSSTDESYSPFTMITSILEAYGGTLMWVMILAVCLAAGWIFFKLLPEKLQTAGKVAYVCCLPVLVRLFWGRGMFTFTYYNYRCMYEWGMLLLYMTLVSCITMLFDTRCFRRDRLLALIVLLVVVVTPIGSNNDTMPALNNLFLAAPLAVWGMQRLIRRYQKTAAGFPLTALTAMVLVMVLVQGIGFKCSFSFADGIYGEKRDAKVENSAILKGMETRTENAESLTGLVEFLQENGLCAGGDGENAALENDVQQRSLLTFGNAPGLNFILDMPLAISHGWPDLDTYPEVMMKEELDGLSAAMTGEQDPAVDSRPVVIVYKKAGSVTECGLTVDGSSALDENSAESEAQQKEGEQLPAIHKKMRYLEEFLTDNEYTLVYENDGFQVFE